MWRFLVFLLASSAQGDDLASATTAISAIERSIQAHGGAALDQLKLRLTIRGDIATPSQSLNAEPPFETYPSLTELWIDAPARQLRVEHTSGIAGDFQFADITVLKDGKGFALTPEVMTWRETTSEPWVLNQFLPHRTLQRALQNRSSLRWLRERDGLELIHSVQGGQLLTLHLDKKTGLLRGFEQVQPMSVYGDGYRQTFFEDYRPVGRIQLPTRLRMRTTNSVLGTFENVYRYENAGATVNLEPSQMEMPKEYRKADYSYRGAFAVRTLAPGVYLLENVTSSTDQWSYNIFVVAFDEFVLVGEAPVSGATSEAVLKKIAELAPGRPVRYLAQSHHHSDHLAGIRTYIAEGATILAGPSAKRVIEKIAAAPYQLDPDRLQRNPRKPVVETVTDSKTIRDSSREVVIYNIGPSPHAADMLFIYLPKEKILYQSDMVNEGEYPENETTRDFFGKLQRLGIEYQMMVGLHGRLRAR